MSISVAFTMYTISSSDGVVEENGNSSAIGVTRLLGSVLSGTTCTEGVLSILDLEEVRTSDAA